MIAKGLQMRNWPPKRNDLRTMDPIIPIGYKRSSAKKFNYSKKPRINNPQKHIIHKAIQWKKCLIMGKWGQ